MKFSLGKKITLTLIVFAAILCVSAIMVSSQIISQVNDRSFKKQANEEAAVVAKWVDSDTFKHFRDKVSSIYYSVDNHVMSDEWGSAAFDAYVANFEDLKNDPEYKQLLDELRDIQSTLDVDCVYTAFIDPIDKKFVYVVDADESEDACPIGCIDELLEENRGVIDNPELGLPAYVSNLADYGWLVTAAAPIHSASGEVVGIACVDISMDYVKAEETVYTQQLVFVMSVVAIILTIIVVIFVHHFETAPLKSLSEAAQQYCAPGKGKQTSFENIEITNRDEIGDLHQSMIKMEHDIDTYIDNLKETRTELSATRQQATRMEVLATEDALTGVRNKRAYDQEMEDIAAAIAQGDTKFGLAIIDLNDLKVINDTYGHERGDISILSLSQLICRTFKHSPVFRIGGDEFCAVLKGADYEMCDELVSSFTQKISELSGTENNLQPWERISAAIGHARFDPVLDDGPESVFRRADESMYANKRRMKGEREIR